MGTQESLLFVLFLFEVEAVEVHFIWLLRAGFVSKAFGAQKSQYLL